MSSKVKKKIRRDTQKKGGTQFEKIYKREGKRKDFQKKKSKKRVLSNTNNNNNTTTTPSFISLADRCVYIYTYIDLLGRARADVVVTVV